jgi:hypothetical protein
MIIDMMMLRAQYIAMNKPKKTNILAAAILALSVVNTAEADDVRILAADFQSSGGNTWSVNVTLKHGDTGWDHYADNWRVVDGEGNVIGDRVLHHPHVNEQPFTRSLGGVKVPEGIVTVYIEAHDKVHGWTKERLTVDLDKAVSGHLRVEAK